eukprot:gene12237-15582_t
MAIYRGIAFVITKGQSVGSFPAAFRDFVRFEVGDGLSFVPLATMIVVLIVGWIFLSRLAAGRRVYAIGGNELAARFSGIRVNATKLWIYTGAGLCSALAAVIFVSRVTTTRSDMGTGLELDVITGVVLGGTSIFGGRGTIIGTVLGLILIQALKNGLALSGVKGDGTIVVIGLVLIGAILMGALFDKNRGG